MLHSISQLKGLEIAAIDGIIGHVREVYFDDHQWAVRHVVVDTGGWLTGRQVLVSPQRITGIDMAAKRLDAALTKKQIEDAPGVETDKPVSRQYEMASADFYGYPYYWSGAGLWGGMDLPLGVAAGPIMAPDPDLQRELQDRRRAELDAADPHLRSSAEVMGYKVAARDGDIGHIADFLVDATSWQISLLVVDTNNWLPDRLVLVPPWWVDSVDWTERHASFKVSRKAVENSAPYTQDHTLAREDAQRVQRHFESSI